MIVYVENSREPTEKLLEPVSGFTKVAGYKVDIQNEHIPLHAA